MHSFLTDDIYVVAALAGPPEPPFYRATAKAASEPPPPEPIPDPTRAATTTASTLVEHNAWIRVYNSYRETCPSLCHLQHDPRGLARLLLCGAYRDRRRGP